MPSLSDNEFLISQSDIPEFIGRSKSFVAKLIKDGRIRPVGKEGKTKFFYKDEVRHVCF